MSLRRAIERFPLEDYLDKFGSEITGTVERQIPCPSCGKDKLIVNIQKKVWHCWYCQDHAEGGKGHLLDLIRVLEGIDKSQAIQRIMEGYHDHVSIDQIEVERKILAEEARNVVPIPPPPNWRFGSIDSTGILPYCEKRGITHQDVIDFGLLWCNGGKYHNRLIFPVWEGEELVYWQARAMWEKSEQKSGKYIKALNPPRHPGAAGATDVIMNLARARNFRRVTLVEGPIDCIHVGLDAVCTFGKKISQIQIEKLAQAGVRSIDLMWDGPGEKEPKGAWPEMFKAAKTLSLIFDVRLVFLPRGDPGDYTREQLRVIRQTNVRKYSQFSRLQEA